MTVPSGSSTRLHATAKELSTWLAPAVGIPALRYFQDDRKERNRLFIRDASTYTLGALIFLVVYRAGFALLCKSPLSINERTRDLVAFLIALTTNILYAGIGAVRLSRRLGRSLPPSPSPVPGAPPDAFAPLMVAGPFRALQTDVPNNAPRALAYFPWPTPGYVGIANYGATLL